MEKGKAGQRNEGWAKWKQLWPLSFIFVNFFLPAAQQRTHPHALTQTRPTLLMLLTAAGLLWPQQIPWMPERQIYPRRKIASPCVCTCRCVRHRASCEWFKKTTSSTEAIKGDQGWAEVSRQLRNNSLKVSKVTPSCLCLSVLALKVPYDAQFTFSECTR